MSLAFIGGYTAIAWQIVSILIGSYQSFSYEHSLVAALYTEEKPQHIGTPMYKLSDREEIERRVLSR